MTVAPRQLHVQDLEHSFATRTVLTGIDLQVRAGQTVALVGPSGCGKTTLLHLCAGLIPVRSGRITSSFVRPACMFQQPRLLPWKSARENIALGLKADGIGRRKRTDRASALGLRMGLVDEDLDKYPHQLSGGMQSRVALARALAIEPDLILLDEPFAALDIGLKTELHALLLEQVAARDMAALVITHDLMEAVRLSTRVLVMAAEPGRITRRFAIDRPLTRRDDPYVYSVTANLLQDRVVRASFELAPPTSGQAPMVEAGSSAATASVRILEPEASTREPGIMRGPRC